MSELPPTPPPSKRPAARVFMRGFNIEDLILYVFALLVLVLFGIFFYQHYRTTVRPESSEPLAQAWLSPSGGDVCTDYLRAQLTNTALRYDQARIATATNAVRRSLAFLIGTIGFMLGCIIIVRGVRDTPVDASLSAEGKAQIRLITSSPGVVVVTLSVLIILSVVLLNDRVQVTDPPISLAYCAPVVASNDPAATAPTATPDPRKAPPPVSTQP